MKFGTGKNGGHVLTWENRMLIAMEAAQGDETKMSLLLWFFKYKMNNWLR